MTESDKVKLMAKCIKLAIYEQSKLSFINSFERKGINERALELYSLATHIV